MRPVILDTYCKLDSLDIACIGDVVCSVLFLQGPQTHNKKVFNEWDWYDFLLQFRVSRSIKKQQILVTWYELSLAFVIFSAKAAAMEILPKAAYVMAFGSWMFICFWVNPKLDQIKDMFETDTIEKLAMEDEIKRKHQRLCGLLDSKEGQFEARDSVGEFSEGQTY
jgi:hypothetical protein